MNVLDLFSGIGGFSLGLERAGFRTVAFCEIDPYCRAVLRKHWPDVPIYEDVRELTADALARDGIAVDAVCGGFPCQDLSHAGKRAGLEGDRSGLWSEYARLIGEVRPRYVIVENVPGLLSLGMGRVLGNLAALGYDATWDCIPASAVGAPHRRDRVWIVAHARGEQHEGDCVAHGRPPAAGLSEAAVAHAAGQHEHGRWSRPELTGQREPSDGGWWLAEPDVGRVAHGVCARVDRLRALGNAVVPQVVEEIGRAIIQAELAA